MAIPIIDGVCACATCAAAEQAAQVSNFSVWNTPNAVVHKEDRLADEEAELDFYYQEMEQIWMAEETAEHIRESYGWCP